MPDAPLPLFPLNTVLFPRMPLPLHVFEERYQLLVQRCVESESPFGVVLIKEGGEVGAPAVPQMAGTLARIHAVKPLEEGRLHILTVGTERFRLLDYATDAEPYLVGMAEPLQDAPYTPAVVEPLAASIVTLFHDYFHGLVAQAGVEMPEYELPDDPVDLSFVIASVVQLTLPQRQAFLEMTDTAARLSAEKEILEREMARLRRVTRREPVRAAPFEATGWKQFLSNN